MKIITLLLLMCSFSYSQNYLSHPYQIQQPTSNINVELVQQTLNYKQVTYNNNLARINSLISSIMLGLDNSSLDTILVQTIKNRFYFEYVKPFYNKSYDLSSNNVTEGIVNWLKNGFDYVLKTETVKFIEKLDNF